MAAGTFFFRDQKPSHLQRKQEDPKRKGTGTKPLMSEPHHLENWLMRSRHFEITYCLNDSRRMFVQPDIHMTDEDAWYYACLHAGVGLLYGEDNAQDNHAKLLEHAEKSGLTYVKWEELP
jgi:hypothetical protein